MPFKCLHDSEKKQLNSSKSTIIFQKKIYNYNEMYNIYKYQVYKINHT